MINNENPGSTKENPKLENVDNAVNQLDELRLEGLIAFQKNMTVKDEILNLEKIRLSAKYDAHHQMVKETESRLVFNQQLVPGLAKEIAMASVIAEPFDSKSWRINGIVFDHHNKPVPKLTVYFSNQKKNWVRSLGQACTTETGYYSLTLNEKMAATYQKQRLFLSVSDKKKVVYISPEPLPVSPGIIVDKDVKLNEKDCTAPPTG